MNIKTFAIRLLKKVFKFLHPEDCTSAVLKNYNKRFRKYAFTDCKCDSFEQFEASITRLYHTIEKGLTYENYRAGFGKSNIERLVLSLEQYVDRGYDKEAFCYRTALSCLNRYIEKNKDYGYVDIELERRVSGLPGKENGKGGTIAVSNPENSKSMNFKELVTTRHSIRHFSDEPVDLALLNKAVSLAQYTPSACNRQGWRTYIISDKDKISEILENQNGNRGFGHEIDKLLLICSDLRAQQRNREIFQAFIDGGMYAQNIINSLFYYGICSVPLSAALTDEQEINVRNILDISDAEVLILFIGVGNYPKERVITTRSERRKANEIQSQVD